jgi:hypothetical protein
MNFSRAGWKLSAAIARSREKKLPLAPAEQKSINDAANPAAIAALSGINCTPPEVDYPS